MFHFRKLFVQKSLKMPKLVALQKRLKTAFSQLQTSKNASSEPPVRKKSHRAETKSSSQAGFACLKRAVFQTRFKHVLNSFEHDKNLHFVQLFLFLL